MFRDVAGFAAVAAVVCLQAPAETQQQPAFRGGTDLVSLNVTVNVAGTTRYVTGLEAKDFEVYEDGAKQDITLFNNSNSPLALSLLMDTSASMDTRMNVAQEAAIGFARTIRHQDLAEFIDFDSKPIVGQPFTSDVPLLERAIRRTSAGGSTSMFNAVYIALDELKKLAREDPVTRRQAIVLVSDGEDTTSIVSFDGPDGVLERAKRSETAIYTVGLRSPDEARNPGFKQPQFVLRQLATQTGGRAFFPEHINDLAGVYTQIADELSMQYQIGYTSKNSRRDGAWRRIIVRIAGRTDAQTRTKQGYFAPAR